MIDAFMQGEWLRYAIPALNIVLIGIVVWIGVDLHTGKVLQAGRKSRLFSSGTAQKLIFLSDKREKELNKQLNSINMKISAREFYARNLMQGTIFSVLTYFAGGMILSTPTQIIMTVMTFLFGFYYPVMEMKSRIKNRRLRRSVDLPRYLKVITNLLRTQPAYDAISKSLRYAPDSISEEAKLLLLEVSQYPNTAVPFNNFADRVDVLEARQFMLLLYQALDISQTNSKTFIEKLNHMSEQLENESAKKMAVHEAKSMAKYNYIMLTAVVMLPLSLALVTMMGIMGKFS